MLDATLPLISGWQNFYIIVGPSAAALLGLQFVVVALVKDAPIPTSPGGVNGFTTPTIVHFATVLSIAAVLSAPWRSIHSPALVIGVGSALLAIYVLIVARRIARMTGYAPVAEDWVWHVVIPLAVYATLIVSALELEAHLETVLFVIAGASLVLLFDGIHNAWDIATYIALQVGARAERASGEGAPNASAPNASAPGDGAPERESALSE